jgi:hypothetical protein
MLDAICPSCHKKLHIPDHLAGRRIACPRCGEALTAPVMLPGAVEDVAAEQASSAPEDQPFPLSARLGILGLALGVASILLLCVPVIGYISIGLSVLGLLAALGGLLCGRPSDRVPLSPQRIREVGLPEGFGRRASDYSLAGLLASFLALALALLPFFFS